MVEIEVKRRGVISEKLAKRFFPDIPVKEVQAAARRQAKAQEIREATTKIIRAGKKPSIKEFKARGVTTAELKEFGLVREVVAPAEVSLLTPEERERAGFPPTVKPPPKIPVEKLLPASFLLRQRLLEEQRAVTTTFAPGTRVPVALRAIGPRVSVDVPVAFIGGRPAQEVILEEARRQQLERERAGFRKPFEEVFLGGLVAPKDIKPPETRLEIARRLQSAAFPFLATPEEAIERAKGVARGVALAGLAIPLGAKAAAEFAGEVAKDPTKALQLPAIAAGVAVAEAARVTREPEAVTGEVAGAVALFGALTRAVRGPPKAKISLLEKKLKIEPLLVKEPTKLRKLFLRVTGRKPLKPTKIESLLVKELTRLEKLKIRALGKKILPKPPKIESLLVKKLSRAEKLRLRLLGKKFPKREPIRGILEDRRKIVSVLEPRKVGEVIIPPKQERVFIATEAEKKTIGIVLRKKGIEKTFTEKEINQITGAFQKNVAESQRKFDNQVISKIFKKPKPPPTPKIKEVVSGRQKLLVKVQERQTRELAAQQARIDTLLLFKEIPAEETRFTGLEQLLGRVKPIRLLEEEVIVAFPPGVAPPIPVLGIASLTQILDAQAQIQTQSQLQLQIQSQRQLQSQRLLQGQQQKQFSLQEEKFKLDLKQFTETSQITVQGQKQLQLTLQRQALVLKQELKLKPPEVIPKLKPPALRPPPLPIIPPPPLPPILLPERKPIKKPRVKARPGYSAFAKVRGKPKKIADNVSRISALSFGSEFVDQTPAASFTIKPTGRVASGRDIFDWESRKFKFRPPIRRGKPVKSEIIIEKNQFRIDTAGEVAGIPLEAKRLKEAGLSPRKIRKTGTGEIDLRRML